MNVFSQFLDRYRIQPGPPDLPSLTQLASAFAFLPYENVTKILKQVRSCSPDAKLRQPEEVIADHLRWNTGGTCFSLCNAFLNVLRHSGYNAFIAMGDMHYATNIHCAIIVNMGGARYLLDPGYLLHEPILLPAGVEETVVRTSMNLVIVRGEADNRFSLYTLESGREKWRYRLKAWPAPETEFVAHWIHSFSLNSMEHLTLSRVDAAGRLYFRKNSLERVASRSREKCLLESNCADELSRIFGIPADLILQARNAVTGRGNARTDSSAMPEGRASNTSALSYG
jgi:arylamine N-acetyltransferase